MAFLLLAAPVAMPQPCVADRAVPAASGAAPARVDPAAQLALVRQLFREDRPRGYAQARLAAMAGVPGAIGEVAHLRRRASVEDRLAAVGILAAMLAPPSPPLLARAVAGWSPDEEAGALDLTITPPSPKVIRVGRILHGERVVRPMPIPMPVAAAVPNAKGDWRVQLGAFRVMGAAPRQWQLLSRSVGTFAGLAPRFVAAGAFTRLQLTGLDRTAAEQLCADAVAAGARCFTIAPRPPFLMARATGLAGPKQI